MKRYPAVEGRFYPDTKDSVFSLISKIEEKVSCAENPGSKRKIIGAVIPHAGHIYSAYQTIPFFKYLIENNIFPDTFIILNPNHSGIGIDIALEDNLAWINCIGEIEIDKELNDILPYPHDSTAQENEHSAEVIIPFMQYYFKDHKFKILPICMQKVKADKVNELAENLHLAIQKTGRSVMIIASSDFSHFHIPAEGRIRDDLVLENIIQKDFRALENTVVSNRISVCGYVPIMVLMAYAEIVENDYMTTILARGHSGEVHPARDVVDYISIMFHSKS